MVISSLVIETEPAHTKQVARDLTDINGVEVHEISSHKIVITIEANSLDESHGIASKFISLVGVTGINLVYANFEDDPQIQKASA